jgi:uncharacterized protein with HEPN domain
MSETNADYVRDMLRELDDITAFTADGAAAFLADLKTQKAVIRSYEVTGEIAKRLPTELRNTHPNVPWRRLITFRDFLAHNYDEIALRYIWEAVEDVPNLRRALEALLAELDEAETTE